jgi:hypothetical protein
MRGTWGTLHPVMGKGHTTRSMLSRKAFVVELTLRNRHLCHPPFEAAVNLIDNDTLRV